MPASSRPSSRAADRVAGQLTDPIDAALLDARRTIGQLSNRLREFCYAVPIHEDVDLAGVIHRSLAAVCEGEIDDMYARLNTLRRIVEEVGRYGVDLQAKWQAAKGGRPALDSSR